MKDRDADFLSKALKQLVPEEYGPGTMEYESTQLMILVKAGQHDAFDDLVLRLRSRAFQVARSMVGSREDALDLSQEAFLKVFRARLTFRDGQPFLPWFHRILRNTCFTFLRDRGRLRQVTLNRSGDEDDGDWELVDPSPGPVDLLHLEDRERLFWEGFRGLSARDREILTLRHFQDLPYREIADSLGIPQGTVMSRLFHARKRLAEVLAPVLDGQAPPSVGSELTP